MTSSHPFDFARLGVATAFVFLAGCGKQQPGITEHVPVAKKTLIEHGTKLGFAAHLPKSTEGYLGSINLKAHLEAAKKTAFWKEVSSFMDDKLPAPSKNEPEEDAQKKAAEEALKKLGGDDVFIAFGKGSGPALKGLMKLTEIHNEITYRALMAGGPLAGAAGGIGSSPDKIIASLTSDPDLLKRAAASLSKLQLPAILIGAKTDKPDEVISALLTEKVLADISKKAKISDRTTVLGGKFKVFETKLDSFLTDEVEKQIIEALSQQNALAADNETAGTVAKAIDEIQARTVSLALGAAGGHVILAAGMDLAHLEFVEQPSESLLSRPEMARLLPYAEKDLVMLASVSADLAKSLVTDRPTEPILRGLISGLKSSELLRDLATSMEPKVAALGDLEAKLNQRTFEDGAAIGWWEQGFHMESFGGHDSDSLDHQSLPKFGTLLQDPGLVFGVNYIGQKAKAVAGRAYFEAWIGLLYQAAGELVKSGLGGEQTGMMFAMADKMMVPELLNFYNGSKTIYQEALGQEHAMIVELGGRLGSVPGVPQEAAEKKILRLAGVHDVVNRPLIGATWAKMDGAVKRMLAGSPLTAQLPMPAPLSSEKNGITTWFYPLPFATEDLLPCASVNDRTFIFSTSKGLAEGIAGRLTEAKPASSETGLKWRLRFANLREIVKTSATLTMSADAAEGVQTVNRWLAPFEDMSGRCWQENGQRRDSMSWEIHDVKKYD